MWTDNIKDERVLVNGTPCDICSNPDYLGKTDVYYEYEYCANCGRILSLPCGDYIEESAYYDENPEDY